MSKETDLQRQGAPCCGMRYRVRVPKTGRFKIDYSGLLKKGPHGSTEAMIGFLTEELAFVWRDAYVQMGPRLLNIVHFRLGTFEYFYDDHTSLEAIGAVPYDPEAEARLVGVYGRSVLRKEPRSGDDNRLRGWVGRTDKTFPGGWDKGHFIAHSIGGAVDRAEVNVFVQRRHLNRGWSPAGKRYRKMEEYCALNPGTFCFSRPIYLDQSAKPAFVEFGILKTDRVLWVEFFDNR